MVHNKKKIALGTPTKEDTRTEFDKFNAYVIEIICNLIDNGISATRDLAKNINTSIIKVHINSHNRSVMVKYSINKNIVISKTFTVREDVKEEFDKLVL